MESLLKALTEPQQINGDRINGHDDTDLQSPQCVAGPMQMIGADGTFFEDDTSNFITDSKELIAQAGAPYAVISLLGTQFPGKGILLSSLFNGNFSNVDASKGRGQNTKGIWLSRCTGPSLLVMDVDFSDEKGDDLSFEKQSVLFALAVSDFLMVDMSLQDFNKDQPAIIQLFRTLFEERVKIDPGQTKVLVILHGYDDKPPLSKLQEDVFTKMEKLWTSIHNKPDSTSFLFSYFFEVLVVGLPDKSKANNYFEEKVSKMRRWFGDGKILGFNQDRISALGFTLSAKFVWETIRQRKRLNLLSNSLTISSIYCERIVREKLDSLTPTNEDILALKKSTEGFSENLKALLDLFLTRYDIETQMYETDVRMQNRHEFEIGILKRAESVFKDVLTELHSKAFYESKENIATQLSQINDPVTAINDLVNTYIKKFVKSCNDLNSKYQELCNEHCEELRRELVAFSEIMADNIKERRQREKSEKAREEAESQSRQFKTEAENAKKETEKIVEKSSKERETTKREIEALREENTKERRKREKSENAREEAERQSRHFKTEAENAKKETEKIVEKSSKERETAKREIEALREENTKVRERGREREEAEKRRRGVWRRFRIVRAVLVVARVVVFKDPTVIVDILEFALWNKCHGSGGSGNLQNVKDC